MYSRHELSEIFPDMPTEDIAKLAGDIQARGLMEPIVTLDGQILDGWHRYQGCLLAGVAPALEPLGKTVNPVDFVLGKNLHRRHITATERAEVVIKAHGYTPKMGRPESRQSCLLNSDQPKVTQAELAEKAQVSPRTIRNVLEKTKPHVAHNSGENNEWYTPQVIIDAARAVMGGIDLDPASNPQANETVQATTFYTAEDDGLSKEWAGKLWMNPPYSSRLVGRFVDKLLSSESVDQAIVLVNNCTETRWGQALFRQAAGVCFLTGRVRFIAPDGVKGAPLQGQAVVLLGGDAPRFQEIFGDHGVVFLAHDYEDDRITELESALELADFNDAPASEQQRTFADLKKRADYEISRANALQNEVAAERKDNRKLAYANKKLREELRRYLDESEGGREPQEHGVNAGVASFSFKPRPIADSGVNHFTSDAREG